MFVPLQGCIEKGQTNNAVCLFFWYTTPYFLPIINIAQIPVFFELTNDNCGRIMPSNMRKSMRYQKYYIMYGYVLFILLIPWTAMIILNIFVVKAVHRAYKIRRTMQGTKSHEERDRRCTIMALCMVTTFLLFNIVAAINNINEPFQLGFPRQLQPLGNLLVCINSASNIVIYALFGARFRQMCVLMLCGRNSRWMIWLKAGGCRMIVSDWDGKDLTTRKTSLDASTALLSTRHSRARADATPVLGADGLRLHRLSAASAQLDPQDRHRHACRMTSCSSAANRSRSGSRKGRTNRRRSNRLRLDGILLSTLTLPTSVDSRCSSRRSSANSMISIERM
ncbi:hypothetical protein WR25_12791 [Diploscapter pachys]|uniref:G-protein coupled receptors family 1 profile domain-containing protein n=1 Tax=Diploscapter pachys TaxID=2018661 RepID=A0A2A2K8B9_9BILA|nr:hypothetical protein WR25_12791 [Diploscapter pachys]